MPTEAAEDDAAPALTPPEIDLRTAAKIMRFFGLTTGIVCVPVALNAAWRWYPHPASYAAAAAAGVTAFLAWGYFAVARRVQTTRHPGVIWVAGLLLLIQLPAFPLTLLSAPGLFYLVRGYRGFRAASAQSAATTA